MPLQSCTWISLLEIQMGELKDDELIEPRGEINPGDEVVGVMTEEHKRLYTLWQNMEERAAEASLHVRFARDQVIAEQALREAEKHSLRARALRQIFTISICDHFEIWNKPTLGLVSGFRVVSLNRSPLEQFFGLQ